MTILTHTDKRRTLALAAVVFTSLAAVLAGTGLGLLSNMDRWCWDLNHVLAGRRHDPASTLIVSLDAQALAAYPNTPLAFWGPQYAKAIERLKLAGAASIALDVLLGITPEQWLRTLGTDTIPEALLDYDQGFDQALAQGRVVLAARPIRDRGAIPVPFPAREYLDALPGKMAGLGLTNLHRDSDNVVRLMVAAYAGVQNVPNTADFPIPEGYSAPDPWWTLGVLAVREAGLQGKASYFDALAGRGPTPIAFCGPPGTIPRLSLAALTREEGLNKDEQALIAGRIVFIGAEFEGAGDRLPTPYSRRFLWLGHRDMSGVEIHANIAETVLNPGRIGTVPLWLAGLLWLPFLAGAALVCDRSSPWKGKGAKAALIGAGWALGLVFFLAGKLLPVAGLITGLGMVFTSVSGLRMTRAERERVRIARLLDRQASGKAAVCNEDCGSEARPVRNGGRRKP